MYPASYNFCAMRIVREGEKPKRVEATCWRVEVVKGARGERFCSLSSTPFTLHVPDFAASNMRSASFSVLGSSTHVAVNGAPLLGFKSAEITQNFSGTKTRISRSRSMM